MSNQNIPHYLGGSAPDRTGINAGAMSTEPMTALQFYQQVWIKERADDPRGNWAIRFAEAYAASLRAQIAQRLRERAEELTGDYNKLPTIELRALADEIGNES